MMSARLSNSTRMIRITATLLLILLLVAITGCSVTYERTTKIDCPVGTLDLKVEDSDF